MQIDPDHTALEGGDRGREATGVVPGNQSDSVSDVGADFSGVAGDGLLGASVEVVELLSDDLVGSLTSASSCFGVSTETIAGSDATGAIGSGVAGDGLLGASVDVSSYESVVGCCTGTSSTGADICMTGSDNSGVTRGIWATRASASTGCAAGTNDVVLSGGVVTFVTGTAEFDTDGRDIGK